MQLPPGFRPLLLTEMLAHFHDTAPTLGEILWTHLQMPEAEARTQISLLEVQGLVQFALSPGYQPEPSVFIAEPSKFDSPAHQALAHALVSFWDTTGKFDADGGRIVSADGPGADVPGNVSVIHTPQGQIGIVQSIAVKLWRLGLITERDGRLVAPSKMELMAHVQEQGICDFCSDQHPTHAVMVPDFDLLPGVEGIPKSEGGWAACETCYQMVTENQRSDLLRRAIEASSGGRFTAAALQGLHTRFWKAHDLKVQAAGIGTGLVDFIEDRIAPDSAWQNPTMQDKARRVEAVRRMTGLGPGELAAMQQGNVLYDETARKLAGWWKKYGADTPDGKRRITEFLSQMDRPVPPGHQPHWQIALDRKVEAIERMSKIASFAGMESVGTYGPRSTGGPADIAGDAKHDVTALKIADVFSFNADTMHAIQQGAQTIPHESTLQSVEIPTSQAGWFWFAEPMAVASAPISSDRTHALLWTWEPTLTTPTIRFSAYVVDENSPVESADRNTILPSTKWYWPVTLSFHDMLGFNHKLYQQAYGPDSPDSLGKQYVSGEEPTLKVVAEMSLFFLMSCLWFRQTVVGTKKKIEPKLTKEPGHVERHARKRYEKAFKTTPTVHVVALRKSQATAVEHVETVEGEKHRLHVRFTVRGHARLQPCGPGMKDRKLIWVDPFIKGPDGAPWKDSGPRVFAVIR